MAQSDHSKLRKELRSLGDKVEDLTGACLSINMPRDAHNTLMVGLHADIMDRFDALEDSFAAVHDTTNGYSDDGETIERLKEELQYQHRKIEDMRESKYVFSSSIMIQWLIGVRRENEIARNHNNYTDSREFTPFAAMRDTYNREIRGFPQNLHELRSLQCEDTGLTAYWYNANVS